jgi:hypothetical protein
MTSPASDRTWNIAKWSTIAAIVMAVIVAVPYLRGRTETVTRERLAAARDRWKSAKITSYDMDLETTGAQTGLYHIEVRAGQLTKFTRNGQPMNPADADYWTVEGWFQAIEDDLENAEKPMSDDAASRCEYWLRVRYHPALGYPLRYVRQQKQPSHRTATGFEVAGSSQGVEMRVIRLDTTGPQSQSSL